MKVICDRAALLEGLNLVGGAAAVRTPRLQLTCIKLVATKSAGAGEMSLAATDAEISIRMSLSHVDVQQAGEVLIPADKLRQIVGAEEGEATLTLESEGDALHIRGMDAHFKVLGYPAADFPPLPDFRTIVESGGADKLRAVMTHPAGSLSELVSKTLFATAKETSRYSINGVLFKRDGKRLEMVATDGRRLAIARTNLAGGEKDAKPVSCIVPVKALNVLQRMVHDNEENVQIGITENQILFSFGTAASPGRVVLTSNLIEGTFPPYEDAIPKDFDKKVTFDRDVLLSAVRRAALLTNEESKGVKMTFHGRTKKVEVASRAPEMGESTITVDLTSYEGDPIDIGFNPNFLLDALKVLPESDVVMELKASSKPGVIRSGTEFTYVVMPVGLN